ncbi:MAG: Wzz/FepE/Etk N-terminal domain-containing protein [Bacteroidales bacterium]
MKFQEPYSFRPDSVNILNIVIKSWKILLMATVAGFIVSAAISLTIKPLYRSETVIYPTTNVTETQSLLGIQGSTIPLFGDESATEKILQILRSDEIRNYLSEKYDLMKHYGIGEKTKYKYTLLASRMNKYIKSRKTQYNSIEISVLDRNAELAAEMANDIAFRVDTIFNKLVKEAGKKSYNAISSSYLEQYSKVKALEDSLKKLTGEGYISFSWPGRNKNNILSSLSLSAGNISPETFRLMTLFEAENENLSAIGGRLAETRMLATRTLPYIYIINQARVSEKKVFPRRKLIVLSATGSVFLLALFILALQESFIKQEK